MRGSRVVITGASGGVGRAAALAFARSGAHLCLAARRATPLEELAAACRALGVHAIAVPTDVTDPAAVAALARSARQALGGIEAWINTAGSGVSGPYQDADIALHRRTVEVNLLGAMHGAHAVLPVFLRQGHGILVNDVSLRGSAPTALAAACTASSFGLRGFSASLRQELRGHPRIHVCTVLPAMFATPGLARGTDAAGRRVLPAPRIPAPEDVAETFLALVRHPREEVAVGWPARAARIADAVAPGPAERVIGRAIHAALRHADPAPLRQVEEGRGVGGGWRMRKGLSVSARQVDRLAAMLLVGGIAMVIGAAIARR